MSTERRNHNMINYISVILGSLSFCCGEIWLGKIQLDYSKIYYSCDLSCSNTCFGLQYYLYSYGIINILVGLISSLTELCIGTIYMLSSTNYINDASWTIMFIGYLIQFAHIYTLITSYVISYHFSYYGECYHCRSCYPTIYIKFFDPLYVL